MFSEHQHSKYSMRNDVGFLAVTTRSSVSAIQCNSAIFDRNSSHSNNVFLSYRVLGRTLMPSPVRANIRTQDSLGYAPGRPSVDARGPWVPRARPGTGGDRIEKYLVGRKVTWDGPFQHSAIMPTTTVRWKVDTNNDIRSRYN